MRTYLLQDYTTIIQPSSVTTVIQAEDAWFELVDVTDLILHVQFLDGTGLPTVNLDTAPSPDETLFVQLATTVSNGTYGDVEIAPIRSYQSTVPPNRFVRWRVGNGTGNPWKLTFRAFLSVNFQSPDGCVLQNGQQIASVP